MASQSSKYEVVSAPSRMAFTSYPVSPRRPSFDVTELEVSVPGVGQRRR